MKENWAGGGAAPTAVAEISPAAWLGAPLLYNSPSPLAPPRRGLGKRERLLAGQMAVPSGHSQDSAMPAAGGLAEHAGAAATTAVGEDPLLPIFPPEAGRPPEPSEFSVAVMMPRPHSDIEQLGARTL